MPTCLSSCVPNRPVPNQAYWGAFATMYPACRRNSSWVPIKSGSCSRIVSTSRSRRASQLFSPSSRSGCRTLNVITRSVDMRGLPSDGGIELCLDQLVAMEPRVVAVLRQELVVRALLRDTSLLQHDDRIGVTNR